MNNKPMAAFAATLMASVITLTPANAASTNVNFSGSIDGLGVYSADVTLDIVNGQALSGTGKINLFGSMRDLGLITTATPGNINESANYPGYPVGFRSNGGDDLFGANTAFPLTQGGLLFAIGTTTPKFGENALLNFYNDGQALRPLVYGFVDTFRAYGNTGILNVTVGATDAPSAVPEPATWAMMLIGFSMIGFGMRYGVRHSNTKFDLKVKNIAAGLRD